MSQLPHGNQASNTHQKVVHYADIVHAVRCATVLVLLPATRYLPWLSARLRGRCCHLAARTGLRPLSRSLEAYVGRGFDSAMFLFMRGSVFEASCPQ